MAISFTTQEERHEPLTPARLASIAARRAHVHGPSCYGHYEPCGEHHAHDDRCGAKRLNCMFRFDQDIADLVAEVKRLETLHGELIQLERRMATDNVSTLLDRLMYTLTAIRKMLAAASGEKSAE